MAEINYPTLQWAGGGANSSANAAIGNQSLVGIQTPAGWLAGTLSLLASLDGGATFAPVMLIGGAWVTASVPAGEQFVAIDPTPLRGIVQLQLLSSVAQTGNPLITLVTRLAM